MRRARVAQMVQEVRRVLRGGAALGRLAVQDTQRVLQVPGPVRRAQLVGPLGQERAQQRDVARLADAVAHGVQLERHLAQTEAGEEVVGQRDDLDVEVGVLHAERLDAQLVVLAVAAVLGVLVPERRRHVPGLPRRHRVVLHEGPGDRGGPLGAQRHHLAVAVLEHVHLLADHLAALADAPQEHAGVLEGGRDRQPVARALDQRGETGDRSLPAGRLGPEDVVHALRGASRRVGAAGNRRGGLARIRSGAPHWSGVSLSCQEADDRRRRHRRDASAR